MTTYIEVHCDFLADGIIPDTNTAVCWSRRNDNPQAWSLRFARLEARRMGWVKRRLPDGTFGDCCPGCQGVHQFSSQGICV